MLSWQDWLDERVDCGGTTRKTMIWNLVTQGLLPLMKRAGYTVDVSPLTLCSRIATGLYENQGLSSTESTWNYHHENTDYMMEDLDRYTHVLGPEEWDAFWEIWNDWEDVSEDSWRGLDRRTDIQAYMWTQLNLERSAQKQVVNEFLRGAEEEDDWGAHAYREDTYVQEARESGQYDGYRK